jgi:hypothetical protein
MLVVTHSFYILPADMDWSGHLINYCLYNQSATGWEMEMVLQVLTMPQASAWVIRLLYSGGLLSLSLSLSISLPLSLSLSLSLSACFSKPVVSHHMTNKHLLRILFLGYVLNMHIIPTKFNYKIFNQTIINSTYFASS